MFNKLIHFRILTIYCLLYYSSYNCLDFDHDLDYLLIAANSFDQPKDQDLLTHLVRNLASLSGTTDERNHAGLLQDLQNAGTSLGTDQKVLFKFK